VPFIPGLRDIPRLVPVHRLVWRDAGREQAPGGDTTPRGPAAAAHKS
jgi:hypothetical protein